MDCSILSISHKDTEKVKLDKVGLLKEGLVSDLSFL